MFVIGFALRPLGSNRNTAEKRFYYRNDRQQPLTRMSAAPWGGRLTRPRQFAGGGMPSTNRVQSKCYRHGFQSGYEIENVEDQPYPAATALDGRVPGACMRRRPTIMARETNPADHHRATMPANTAQRDPNQPRSATDLSSRYAENGASAAYRSIRARACTRA